MSATPPPTDPADRDAHAVPDEGRRATVVVLVVLVVAVVGVLVWVVAGGGDDEVTTADDTTTSVEPPSTPATADTAPDSTPETSATGGLSPDEVPLAVYPYADDPRTFDDPVEVARAFATELAGFVDPVLGDFAQGDSRSGEVEVRAAPGTVATTVLVRQLGAGDSWWVIGAVTADIQVDSPAREQVVTTPLAVSGRATGFEGNVVVTVHRDGDVAPIGTGNVTGGALGELALFSGEVAFSDPGGAPWGVVVFASEDVERGGTFAATVVRVGFGT